MCPNRQFCDRYCRGAWLKAHPEKNVNVIAAHKACRGKPSWNAGTGKKVTIVCAQCGNKKERYLSQTKGNRQSFCCEACRNEWLQSYYTNECGAVNARAKVSVLSLRREELNRQIDALLLKPGTMPIELTQGFKTVVDKEDYILLARYKWHINESGYAVANIDGKKVRMQRLLLEAPKGRVVDHKNGITLDNRKLNLRLVTYAENSVNRKNVKGYFWEASRDQWRVTFRGKEYGRYKNELEAKAMAIEIRQGLNLHLTKGAY